VWRFFRLLGPFSNPDPRVFPQPAASVQPFVDIGTRWRPNSGFCGGRNVSGQQPLRGPNASRHTAPQSDVPPDRGEGHEFPSEATACHTANSPVFHLPDSSPASRVLGVAPIGQIRCMRSGALTSALTSKVVNGGDFRYSRLWKERQGTVMSSTERFSRRDLLRVSAAGWIGAAAMRAKDPEAPPLYRRRGGRRLYQPPTEPSSVSLVKGNDRRGNIYNSLKLIEDQVFGAIGDRRILIKPNFVQTSRQLAATHVDAVRGILEFLRTHYKKEILIGEAAAGKEGTLAGYKNYGYPALEKEYKVRLADLNLGNYQYRYTFGEKNAPVPIRICSPFLDPNLYIISAAILKTHGFASITLSLKNMLLGAPMNDYATSDKGRMHLGPHGEPDDIIHFNMFHLAQEVYPDLAVLDGFTGMEGDGPSRGTPVDSRVALASADPLAADTLGARVMGFDAKKILYLSAMAEAGMGQGNLDKIRVLGNRLDECSFRFKNSPLLRFSAALES